MSTVSIPPILSLLISHIAAAVPRRARITFTELLIGAAATRGGHVTDAILAAGLSRSWTTYYWLLQRGRWTWLAVWQALLRVLQRLFDPPVWHVVLDDTLVERISARAWCLWHGRWTGCRRKLRSEEHTSELQSRQYLVCR